MPTLAPPSSAGAPQVRMRAGGESPPIDFDGDGDGSGGGGDDPHRDRRHGWVTVAAYWYPAQAHIARLRLESAGVPCVLVGEIAAATHVLNIATGGVKLQVPRAQCQRAIRLLQKQGSEPLAEPRVALADFERLLNAKAAACVVEAAGLWCEVIERCEPHQVPPWARWLTRAWRARLWPAASVVVQRTDIGRAARALGKTPFARGLTGAAVSTLGPRRCGSCDATQEWAIWQLVWRDDPDAGAASAVRALLPRLVRRCARCGGEWAGCSD